MEPQQTSMGAKACSYPEDATPTPTGPPIGTFPIPGVSHGCDAEPQAMTYDLHFFLNQSEGTSPSHYGANHSL